MSFSLPPLSSNSSFTPNDELPKRSLPKDSSPPSSLVSFPPIAISQKSKTPLLSSSNKTALPSFADNNKVHNNSAIESFSDSFKSLNTSDPLSSHDQYRVTRDEKSFIEAGMVKQDSFASELPDIFSSTKTNSSSIDTSFASFSICKNDFIAIDPSLSSRKASDRELCKLRAKLDRCIAIDPSIIHSSGSRRTKKIQSAWEQINLPRPTNTVSSTPSPSLDSFSNLTSQSTDDSSSTKTDSSSRDMDFASFSISKKDFKVIKPTLSPESLSRREIRKLRTALDTCIDRDPSIVHKSGLTRTKKIESALEQIKSPKFNNSDPG